MSRTGNSDSPLVLLVDDDYFTRDVCATYLSRHGFAVETAANGREAQDFLRENPGVIQILITDHEMPFVSGTELADFAAASGSCCPVLLMSGNIRPAEVEQKGWSFLAKPFVPSVLLQTVKHLLSGVRARPRALVAEDDTDMRTRVCELLSRDYDVVAALDAGAAVLEKSEELHPDVIVLDISMPDISGLAVSRALQASRSRIPVVFLTQHTRADYVAAAFASGASGYVTKIRMYSELSAALLAVRAGGTYLSADLRQP